MTIKCHYHFNNVASQGNENNNHEAEFRDGILANRRSRVDEKIQFQIAFDIET